jgi:hypothetical protein
LGLSPPINPKTSSQWPRHPGGINTAGSSQPSPYPKNREEYFPSTTVGISITDVFNPLDPKLMQMQFQPTPILSRPMDNPILSSSTSFGSTQHGSIVKGNSFPAVDVDVDFLSDADAFNELDDDVSEAIQEDEEEEEDDTSEEEEKMEEDQEEVDHPLTDEDGDAKDLEVSLKDLFGMKTKLQWSMFRVCPSDQFTDFRTEYDSFQLCID